MAPTRRFVVALITALSLLFAYTRPAAERVAQSECVIRVAPPAAPAIVALRAAFHAVKAKHAQDHDAAGLEFLPSIPFSGVAPAVGSELVAFASPFVGAPDTQLPLPNARGPPRV